MAAYSDDLRRRVLDAALKGDVSEQAVADRFGVSRSFVQKMKRLYRTTGSVAPSRARRGPPPRLSEADRDAIADWLAQTPTATAAQLASRLEEERGVVVSRATVSRVVLKDGLRYKKKGPATRHRAASGASPTGSHPVNHHSRKGLWREASDPLPMTVWSDARGGTYLRDSGGRGAPGASPTALGRVEETAQSQGGRTE